MNEKKSVGRQELVLGLKKLGVKEGTCLLVHSALSRIGFVEGGADTFIDALLEAVGKEGTVMVPTLTGSDKLNKDNPPVFDPANTPCWTGKIPETFRKRKDAVRSLHPTHSVSAIGKQAEYFIKGHEDCLMPCDVNSPYWKVAEKGGYFLFVGVNLDSCTFFHTLEELTGAPYHMQPDKVKAKIITPGGEITRELYLHKYGTEVFFGKVEEWFEKKRVLKKGKVGEADVILLNAKQTAEVLLPVLMKDKMFFTKKE